MGNDLSDSFRGKMLRIPLSKHNASICKKGELVRTHGLWPAALPLRGTEAGGPGCSGLGASRGAQLERMRAAAEC